MRENKIKVSKIEVKKLIGFSKEDLELIIQYQKFVGLKTFSKSLKTLLKKGYEYEMRVNNDNS